MGNILKTFDYTYSREFLRRVHLLETTETHGVREQVPREKPTYKVFSFVLDGQTWFASQASSFSSKPCPHEDSSNNDGNGLMNGCESAFKAQC